MHYEKLSQENQKAEEGKIWASRKTRTELDNEFGKTGPRMQKKETETGREAEKNEQYGGRPDLAGQNRGKGREEVGIKILRAAGRLKNKGLVGKSLKLDMKRGNQDFE